MGGLAGPRSAGLAADYADEYNTVFPTVDEVRERRARVDAACAARGRDPIPFSVMTGVIIGENDADLARRRARVAEISGNPGLVEAVPSGWIVGTLETAREQLFALREAGVGRVMCQHLAHDDLDAVALLGSELAPAVG